MIAEFNYSISNDTLNGSIDLPKLMEEYEELGLSENLLFVKPKEGNLKFVFQEPMVDQVLTDQLLDSMVASHDGVAISKPRIHAVYDGEMSNSDFKDADYTIKDLYPNRKFNKGELYEVCWFMEKEFIIPIIKSSVTYERDAFGFAVSRETTREWYNEDGTINKSKKISHKVYYPLDMIKEGKRRRGNIVDGIQLPTFSFMIEVLSKSPYSYSTNQILLMGRDFMDRFSTDFKNFVDNSSTVTDLNDPNVGRKNVIVALENASTTTDIWLMDKPLQLDPSGNTPILYYLTSQFDI